MSASVIVAKLDLLVRLYDTTTGADLDERNVLFLRNDQPIKPERRGTGTYVFINTGREDFLMRIRAFGYDEYTVSVEYPALDEKLPVCDVFLMPSENTARGQRLVSFRGNLPFLKSIEAVNLNKPICSYQAYDPKSRTMTVYSTSGGGVNLSAGYYGLVNREKESYEKIEVTGTVTSQTFRLKDALSSEAVQGSAIYRIVYGRASGKGDYLLKVTDDAKDLMYLVRYETEEEVRFKIINLRKPEALI